MQVTIRFNTDDSGFVQNLIDAWLESEGITIRTAGGSQSVDLTYVKEI